MSDERRCVDCGAGFAKPAGSKNCRCQRCMKAWISQLPSEPDYEEQLLDRAERRGSGIERRL